MLCPEGQIETDTVNDVKVGKMPKKMPNEAISNLELSPIKNLKTWKKSISNFFRSQLRSTKSNDGDGPKGSQDSFEEKELSPGQKWQSLGKMFRRQSFAEHLPKSSRNRAEASPESNRLTVRKALSSYFGKSPKTPSVSNVE